MSALKSRVPRRRPALAAALLVAGGILFADRVDVPLSLLASGFAVLLAADLWALLRHRPIDRLLQGILLLTLLTAGALRYRVAISISPKNHVANFPYFGHSVAVSGKVAEEPTGIAGRAKIVLEVTLIEYGTGAVPTCGKVMITFGEGVPPPGYGDRLTVEGQLRRPSSARNPGTFDHRAYLLRRGIFGLMFVRDAAQIVALEEDQGAFLFERAVIPLRRSVRASIGRNLLGASRALLIGVLLGDRSGVPEDLEEAFEAAGVIHVLAVSGLHVGLVAGLLLGGIGLFSRSRGITVGIVLPALLLYALMAGLRPSVVRASLMFGLLLVARALERDTDAMNVLGVAALVILGISPQSLFDAGFQLSFAATLAIVALHRPIFRLLSHRSRGGGTWWKTWIALPVAVSLAAQLGTAPIVAYHFSRLAPSSLFANLAVVPMIGGIVALGLAAALFGPWLPGIATLFNATNWLLLQALMGTVRAVSSIPHASVHVPAPSPLFLLLYASILMLGAVGGRSIRAQKAVLFLLLIGANIYVWKEIIEDHDRLEVIFLDVGQGDATFIEFPNGRTMLVDGGPRTPNFDAGASILEPFLRHRGIGRLDAILLTHPDSDHLGGLLHIVEEFDVRHILEPGQRRASPRLGRFLDLVRERGIAHHRVAAGDSLIGLGGAGGLILHPTPTFVADDGRAPRGSNNGSVVLRLKYRGVSVLLTGDVEWETDAALLNWRDRLQCTILKAAHHGAGSSSTQAFLRGTSPEIVVISVGEYNPFGHPDHRVLARCAQADATVYRTDRQGAIMLAISDRGYRIRTMLTDERDRGRGGQGDNGE